MRASSTFVSDQQLPSKPGRLIILMTQRPWSISFRYSLHYHQLLRRGFGSNIHYELIGFVLDLARRNEQVRARIAIDERRLRRREEHQKIQERDYWYARNSTRRSSMIYSPRRNHPW